MVATRAVGAQAAIEVSLGGAVIEAEGATLALAIAGGGFDCRLDAQRLPPVCVIALAPGARLAIRAGDWGAWCYVAIGAAFDLAPTLGSLADHARSQLGPRPLAAGDALPLQSVAPPQEAHALNAPFLMQSTAPIRVLPVRRTITSRATPSSIFSKPNGGSARAAIAWPYALEGGRVEHARGHDIISDGVAFGAIQIPGSGLPFVLMADRQPTGGYPKIATVIGADLGRLAQKRPGEAVRFQALTWDEAVSARRAYYAAIDAGPTRTPLVADLSTETLLAENLVGGVVSARDNPLLEGEGRTEGPG